MSFYYPPWNNALEPNQGDLFSFFTFSAPCRAIKSIWHCRFKCFKAFNAVFIDFFSRKLNGIRRVFSPELIRTRIGTKFGASKKSFKFISTIAACSTYWLSFFPRFNCIFFLIFSPFRSLKPLSCFTKLLSSLFKIKTSLFPVSFKMFRSIKHLQIFDFVIAFVSVLMMDVHTFRNRPMMINPHPSLGVNRHIIGPIPIFLFPKSFSKIFPFLAFCHKFTNVSQSLVSLSKKRKFCKESMA